MAKITNKCMECGEPFVEYMGTGRTMIGYIKRNLPTPDCDHDDNCTTRAYCCRNGHWTAFSVINTCKHCGWRGKEKCFCSTKVDEWPEIVDGDNA